MWKKNNTGKKGDVLKRYLGEAREFLGDRVSSVFLFTMIYSGPLWLKSMKLSGPYVQVLCACAESCHLLLVSPCKWKADLVQLLCSRNSLQWCIIIIPEDFMLKLSPVCIFFFRSTLFFGEVVGSQQYWAGKTEFPCPPWPHIYNFLHYQHPTLESCIYYNQWTCTDT